MAKQLDAMMAATSPHQYALSTRAGCECIAHALQGLAELDPKTTVTSIDGVSAFDLISRGAMMTGLMRYEGGSSRTTICAHVPRSTLRTPLGGFVRHSAQDPQGEGGEQSDAIMPFLFAVEQHSAVKEANARTYRRVP